MSVKKINQQINVNQSDAGADCTTYTFAISEDKMKVAETATFATRFWQIFLSVFASLICIPYGMMLGWPSPTYPNLLQPNNTALIYITMDQSAMIAGFLMIGNTLGTPFSSSQLLGAKYGIMLGITLMSTGWIVMWQARDIYCLLCSRFLVGFGQGVGFGQLKNYILEICEETTAKTLLKQMVMYVYVGVVIIFSYGPFVNFERLCIIAMIVTIFILFLTLFLPLTPRGLIQAKKLKDAKKLLLFLKPSANVEVEVGKIQQSLAAPLQQKGFFEVLKNNQLRNRFVIFAFLVFFQQFSGPAATIVYSQILFRESHCPNPEYAAILYSLVYVIANGFAVFFTPKFNKKYTLLFSSLTLSLCIILMLLVLQFNLNEKIWAYSSVVVMILYKICHVIGLGNVPFMLINDLFPNNYKRFCEMFFVMFHSMLGLVITKIFQVLLDQYSLFVAFCPFLIVTLLSAAFVTFFVPKTSNYTAGNSNTII